MKLRATIWLFAALLVMASSPAWAQGICYGVSGNLVVNCGFETGDFTGWTLGGDASFMGVSGSFANSGNFGAFLGPEGSDSSLSQRVGDNSTRYEISFYLENTGVSSPNENQGGGPNDFTALWNGAPLLSLVNADPFSYTLYTFDVSGNSGAGSNLLEFDMRNDPSFWGLDDVSVKNIGGGTTPEPSSLLLLGSGLLTVGGVIRRKFQANR
ncbi:MAG: PEP-CTERM sorting domain-containing protein [Candidatus Korobacteraceae bacterium]|jgi:hypothetical protein